jgi:hypothetical protein
MSPTLSKRALIGLTIATTVAAGSMLFVTPQTADAQTRERVRSSATATTASSTKKMRGPKVSTTCVSTAVGAREEALITAWDAFATSMKNALTARKSALQSAWSESSTSSRSTKVKAARDEYRKSVEAAHKALRDARQAAHDTFTRTIRQTCKTTVPKEETTPASSSDAAPVI